MDATTRQMLSLLRCSLSGVVPDNLPVSEDEWGNLFKLARKHGVVTMINDAIEQLPSQQQPQGDVALSWALSADRTRYHYNHQAQVLESIRGKAADAGLQLGIIKGMSLSRYYPSPSSRPCGDIDIFFLPLSPETFQQGNLLLGCPDAALDGKHAEFSLDGVQVENHLHFLDLHFVTQRRAERYVCKSLTQLSPEGYLMPMANMVYLLMHTICHLTAKYKLPLRNVLDWGMFLNANRDSLDPAQCHSVMRRIGMLPAFDILTRLAGEFTGTDLSKFFLPGELRQDDLGRMRELILDKKYLEPIPTGLNPLQRFGVRMKRNRQRRWLYRYLPSNAFERTLGNVIHLFDRK